MMIDRGYHGFSMYCGIFHLQNSITLILVNMMIDRGYHGFSR